MGWHIMEDEDFDRIRPCSTCAAFHPKEQQRACFHYTNIQPLWREGDQHKGGRVDWRPEEAASCLLR